MVIVFKIVDVAAGTTYTLLSTLAVGNVCPKILYAVGIMFLWQ
jgi:hypothetical protein